MSQDTYELTNTYQMKNVVVRVHRPVLTEEERTRRMDRFKEATANFMRSVCKAREDAAEAEDNTEKATA